MDKQYITYSNYLEFNGRKLAFKKKQLFDITGDIFYINQTDQGWWINRKLLTFLKAKELLRSEPITIDITDLQWYRQIELQECIKLID